MNLHVVLGDQLSKDVSSLRDLSHNDIVLMCEVRTLAKNVKHHKKKIAFLFSAMRHFAEELKASGAKVRYTKYDSPQNAGSVLGEIRRVLRENDVSKIVVTEPGEYSLRAEIQTWADTLGVDVEMRADDRFLASHEQFSTWAKDRKQLRMEYFYREMRSKFSVLMDGDHPIGGKWNFDSENRKPPKSGLQIPTTFEETPDAITLEVFELVESHFADHFGDLKPFHYAVTRSAAQRALALFIETRLVQFGDYQDAMLQDQPWMFHSHIGLYLNSGLLDPLECIQSAEQAYHQGIAPLNAVEGFIRQILGWREFVRGIYWLKMPDYKAQNYLDADRDLPELYWDGVTKMNCLRQCVLETKQNAYAHHIQRLMVLGNFALLAGLEPEQVNEWYLLVYADAYEWVELPNVHGMVLFADGGVLASKPYAASGAYINKMSNYCSNCSYKVSVKNGPNACPFNYLYWDFIDRNTSKLRGNPRIGLVYKSLDRMSEDRRSANRADAARFFEALRKNEKV